MVTDKNASIIIIYYQDTWKKKACLTADNKELNKLRIAIYDLQLSL